MATENKETKTVTSAEKPTTFNEKGQKVILILGGIAVAALIISMFVGGNHGSPMPTKKDVDNAMGTGQNQQASGFDDQVNFANQQAGKTANQQTIIDQIRQEEKGAYQKTPASWRSQEQLRVLKSRQINFGFESKKANLAAKTQSSVGQGRGNNTQQSVASGITRTQAPQSAMTQINKKIAALQAMRSKLTGHTSNSIGNNYSGSNIDRAGSNIVGRAVNSSYDKSVQNGELLIPTGTVTYATLDQDVNSDYTGPWTGHVVQDIYSVDKQFILIPKGAKIMGQTLHIGNVNKPIQNRMGMTVQWVILPNGKRIDFRRSAAEDQAGIGGILGDVNRHLLWQFGGVAAYALLSASMPRDQINVYGYQNTTFKGQFADGIREQLNPMISKYLSLVPTVTIHAGTPLKIMLQDNIYTQPWRRVNTTVY